MYGPRLDSQLLQIRSLFNVVAIGLQFVRSAAALKDPSLRARTLAHAQQSHNLVRRLMATAPSTPEERTQLGLDLHGLQVAIDDCLEILVE